MKILTCMARASEMEVPRQYAVTCRQRFITKRMDEIDEQLGSIKTWLDENDVNAAFLEVEACDLLIEKCRLLVEIDYMKSKMNKKQTITDDMIEAARQYPVSQLVDFKRGKATAWCHEDRNPSMFHGTRTNTAVCPVCDKKFGPINVLMTRDGLSFVDAVLALASL